MSRDRLSDGVIEKEGILKSREARGRFKKGTHRRKERGRFKSMKKERGTIKKMGLFTKTDKKGTLEICTHKRL